MKKRYVMVTSVEGAGVNRILRAMRRHILPLFVVVLLLTRNAQAQLPPSTSTSEVGPDHSQFLVVIDESGSMRVTDPSRLTLLATLAFIDLLDERDTVSVMGLNQLANLPDSAPLAEFAPTSANLVDRKKLDANANQSGALANYEGVTPCRSALRNVKSLLNDWRSRDPSARQVVLYLTDGVCEGAVGRGKEDPEAVTTWAEGIESQKAGRLVFYLLHFAGNGLTPTLKDYVSHTGGKFFSITRERRLHDLLEGFAGVFTDALGYSVPRIEQGDKPRSFARAWRVRVLAARPTPRAPAELEINVSPTPALTASPTQTIRREVEGKDKFDGHDYRVVTFKPSDTAVSVSVADPAAVVLLVPDYRKLHARLLVENSSCPAEQTTALNVDRDIASEVSPHAHHCLKALLFAGDRALTRADDLDFKAEIKGQAAGQSTWVLEHPGQRPNGFAKDWTPDCADRVFQALVTPDGGERRLESLARSLHPTSEYWRPRLLYGAWTLAQAPTTDTACNETTERRDESLHLAPIDIAAPTTLHWSFLPGHSSPKQQFLDLAIDGKFKEQAIRVDVEGALANHPCLGFSLTDAKDGVVLASAGQRKQLVLSARNCLSGGLVEGTVRVKTVEQSSLGSVPLTLRLQIAPTPWWIYWGPFLVLWGTALFSLLSLVCVVRGFIIPTRALGAKSKGLNYYCLDQVGWDALRQKIAQGVDVRAILEDHPNAGFKGAAQALKNAGSGGWYENASMSASEGGGSKILGPRWLHFHLRSGGAGFLLETRSGNKTILVRSVQLSRINAWADWDVVKERQSRVLDPGIPCRWYAALLGRCRQVAVVSIEEREWYAVHLQSGPDDAGPPVHYFMFDVGLDESR